LKVLRSGQAEKIRGAETDAVRSTAMEPTPFPEASEASRLLATFDCLRIAVTIFDPAGRLAYANAHLNHIFSFLPPPQQLRGKSYEELVRLELAHGAIAAAALAAGPEAFVAGRVAQLREGEFAPRDLPLADKRVLEIKARRATGGYCVLLWSDVTAARAQFARLEEAIALTADAFAFYDSKDRLVMANALYAELVGAPLDRLKGATFAEVLRLVAQGERLADNVPTEDWIAQRLRGHREPAAAFTLRTRSGRAFLLRDRATSGGGRAVVFTDITDKQRVETALAEQIDALTRTKSALDASQARAEQQKSYLADLTRRLDRASAEADSAKTTLLRTMSHELKTPLNAILGFSELMTALAGSLTPAQIREYAGLIHHGGGNLLRMINQIMDLTKIAAGRYELHRTRLDAGSLMWQAREEFAARAAAKSVTIGAENCGAGLMVDADEAVFAGMLHNLLDNAVSFIHAGGHVRLSAAEDAQGCIALTVEDDGPGVAPGDLARIQEPFEHAGAVAEHAKGAGLGLTLVKAFAELHGGELVLTSAPKEGFCATILLPAAR
jgi:signal transduction histidine kinase